MESYRRSHIRLIINGRFHTIIVEFIIFSSKHLVNPLNICTFAAEQIKFANHIFPLLESYHMAYLYYFNSDGTLCTMPAAHNSDGSLRPAGSYSSCTLFNTTNIGHSSSQKTSKVGTINKVAKKIKSIVKKKNSLLSTADVDNLFNCWKKSNSKISEKALRRALAKLASPVIKAYFEQKLCDFEINFQTESNSSNTTAAHISKSQFGEILSTTQVDNIIKQLSYNLYLPSISVLENIKARIVSFSLRDYFDRKVNELRNKKNKYKRTRIQTPPKIQKAKSYTIISNPISKTSNKAKEIVSRSEIESLVSSWIKCNGKISEKTLRKAKSKIHSSELQAYLDKLVTDYTSKKKATGTSNVSKPQYVRNNISVYPQHSYSEKNTIEISTDRGEAIVSHSGGRKPKYGYARDYFGRIQERDHYVENKSINSYHDNSNYDREDDNDSIYNDFE